MSAALKEHGSRPWRIAIVGGGLAGLAAATALADCRLQRQSRRAALQIDLFESRRMLGGRATSYVDPETGELIDNCQHVSLGCCTNFDDFCRRTGIERHFETQTSIHFIGPAGTSHVVRRSRRLRAPLHLAGSLAGLSYLTLGERMSIGRAMWRLARANVAPGSEKMTFGQWLRAEGQSARAIELFWSPVIVSALSEDVDRAGLAMSRKVFVDSFLRNAKGYELTLPRIALRKIYDDHLLQWLSRRGVRVQLGNEVRAVQASPHTPDSVESLLLSNGTKQPVDLVCVAVPWFRIGELFEANLAQRLNLQAAVEGLEGVPITSVHLWCKREIGLGYRIATLPGRFSQWIFDHTRRGDRAYYQVVISASREAAAMPRVDLVNRVCQELEQLSGQPVGEMIVNSKVITEHRAVFSPRPDIEAVRPAQTTALTNLFLAGDWTQTGWPATMEGAVRSGYLAAEAILATLGASEAILVPDLPAASLTRWSFGLR